MGPPNQRVPDLLASGLTLIYWAMFAASTTMLVAVIRTMPDVRLGLGQDVEVRDPRARRAPG